MATVRCPHCGAPLDAKGHCAKCGRNYPALVKGAPGKKAPPPKRK